MNSTKFRVQWSTRAKARTWSIKTGPPLKVARQLPGTDRLEAWQLSLAGVALAMKRVLHSQAASSWWLQRKASHKTLCCSFERLLHKHLDFTYVKTQWGGILGVLRQNAFSLGLKSSWMFICLFKFKLGWGPLYLLSQDCQCCRKTREERGSSISCGFHYPLYPILNILTCLRRSI